MLKLMYNQIDTNKSTSYYFSGIKSFCPVRNNQPTLNTNIPHNKLKNVMRDEFLFQKR